MFTLVVKIKSEHGALSIAELVIAVGIFSLVISAFFAFLVEGIDFFKFSDTQMDAQRSTRTCLTLITKDYRGAGAATISDDGDTLTLRGVLVDGDSLAGGGTSYTITDAPILRGAPPIFYGNNTPISSSANPYTIDYTAGDVDFSVAPASPVTADYTYDQAVRYFRYGTDLRRVVDLDGDFDFATEIENQDYQIVARYVRNDASTPIFSVHPDDPCRLVIDLRVDEDTAALPREYQAKTDVAGPDLSLVAQWHFEEGSGLEASDTSASFVANGGPPYQTNDGVLNGSLFSSESKVGDYCWESGSVGEITVQDSNSLGNLEEITVAGWVNTAGPESVASGTYEYIIEKQNSFGLRIDRSDPVRIQGRIQTSSWVTVEVDLPDEDWLHVALTYDGSQVRLYIDGQEQASASASGGINTSTADLAIGYSLAIPNSELWGRTDEVCIYNQAKSQEQIERLYKQQS